MELGIYGAGGLGQSPVPVDVVSSRAAGYGAAGGESANLAAAIFISGGGQSELSHENGPTLYIEPNRTSAYDDIRSVVIYIFIASILFSFFLILPGLRSEKFPTFLCITTSLVVTSIVMVGLLGTTWHVAEAPISAAYKAFSRDRIQGDLEVRVGLQSVNISLVARKYYFVRHSSVSSSGGRGDDREPTTPVLYENPLFARDESRQSASSRNGIEADENFEREERRSISEGNNERQETTSNPPNTEQMQQQQQQHQQQYETSEYVIKKFKVDINYNERFYWIEPNQMRQEYHQALKRGLPYPILTVVEYLSQDEAGFNWSRQYRSAGYYTAIGLWLSVCLCALMFGLHCAVPKYGVYAMQILGCLLLLTNLTYATLVPRGERALVIPFEDQALTFRFGWNFWLVLVGGCLSLLVGTVIVIIDNLFPSFIFTTLLDADFDSSQECHYYRKEKVLRRSSRRDECFRSPEGRLEKPPPFMRHNNIRTTQGETLEKARGRARALTGRENQPDRARHRGPIDDNTMFPLRDNIHIDATASRL